MTEQPVETEQQFLGNAPYIAPRIVQPARTADIAAPDHRVLPPAPLQHYVPNAHLGRYSPLREKAKQDIQDAIRERAILNELAAASLPAEDLTIAPKTDLLLEAEVHTTHALTMLQSNELDAGIAWLQSALAMALNQRHVEQFGGARA